MVLSLKIAINCFTGLVYVDVPVDDDDYIVVSALNQRLNYDVPLQNQQTYVFDFNTCIISKCILIQNF